MDINSFCFVGRLGRDPIVAHTPNGIPYCRISVAVQGYAERTDWIPAIGWRKLATEVIGKYARKGMLVSIRGRVQSVHWTNEAGENRSRLEVLIEDFRLLETRAQAEARAEAKGGESVPPPEPTPSKESKAESESETEVFADDEPPF